MPQHAILSDVSRPVAANHAIDTAQSDYLVLLPPDALLDEASLAQQMALLETHSELALVIDRGSRAYSASSAARRSRFEWLHAFFDDPLAYQSCGALIRRTCFEAVNGYDERLARWHALDLLIRLCAHGEAGEVSTPLFTSARAAPNAMQHDATQPDAELIVVLRRYLAPPIIDDAARIFPSADLPPNPNRTSAMFQTALLALRGVTPSHRLFGQDTLLSLLADHQSSDFLRDRYGFTSATRAELARSPGMLGDSNIAMSLRMALAQRDRQVLMLEHQLNAANSQTELLRRELAAERSGVTYGLVKQARQLFTRLLPPRSRRKRAYVAMRRALRPGSAEAVTRHRQQRPANMQAPETIFMRSGDALYDDWLEANAPSLAELDTQRATAAKLTVRPTFSVVTPVYNVPAELLERCVMSVLHQTYPHWELCLVDDSSTWAHIRPLLEQLAQRDQRIKVRFGEQNGGIAAASNEALALAGGDFVVFLDNDDELAPHALFSIAAQLQHTPDADMLYSDEDKISPEETRENPYFKPDFSPDLLLSNNYICHMLVMRRSLVEAIGRFRPGFDGAQDYDMVLRAVAHTSRERIIHIPDVLYHWRVIPGSTAESYHSKPKALDATLRLLDEHLSKTVGPDYGKVQAVPASETSVVYHVRYALPSQPLVSIVIGTKDKADVLKACIESIERSSYEQYEIIIVDNNSTEEQTARYLASAQQCNPRVRVVVYPEPFNYSAVNNIGIRAAQGDLIVLLNNDTEVITPDWLEVMLGYALQPRIGAVGIKLLYPNNTIQHAGVILGLGGVAGHSHKHFPADHPGYCNLLATPRNYSAVTAACIMFRREVWREVGGLEEQLAVAFNDVDFCLKIRAAGYDIVCVPQAVMWHHESISVGRVHLNERQMNPFEIEYMQRTWSYLLVNDPFYNPSLTLNTEDYAIHTGRRRMFVPKRPHVGRDERHRAALMAEVP
jgi:GT2 family glycosyltransferase